MRIHSLATLALAVLLTACASAYRADENSPYYVLPAGSHVTLNQALAIPPYQTGVYIQDGHVLPNSEIRHYDAFCKLDLYHQSDSARTVSPDDITVTKAWQQIIQGAIARAPGPTYARATLVRRIDMGGGAPGGPIIASFSTFMALKSEKQPDLFRLTCAHFGYEEHGDKHVTIAEMRRALAPLLTLQIPDESR